MNYKYLWGGIYQKINLAKNNETKLRMQYKYSHKKFKYIYILSQNTLGECRINILIKKEERER